MFTMQTLHTLEISAILTTETTTEKLVVCNFAETADHNVVVVFFFFNPRTDCKYRDSAFCTLHFHSVYYTASGSFNEWTCDSAKTVKA